MARVGWSRRSRSSRCEAGERTCARPWASDSAGTSVSPSAEWVASLPRGKLPDRADFMGYGDDLGARIAAWSRAVQEGERLADEFARWLDEPGRIEVRPLP